MGPNHLFHLCGYEELFAKRLYDANSIVEFGMHSMCYRRCPTIPANRRLGETMSPIGTDLVRSEHSCTAVVYVGEHKFLCLAVCLHLSDLSLALQENVDIVSPGWLVQEAGPQLESNGQAARRP